MGFRNFFFLIFLFLFPFGESEMGYSLVAVLLSILASRQSWLLSLLLRGKEGGLLWREVFVAVL